MYKTDGQVKEEFLKRECRKLGIEYKATMLRFPSLCGGVACTVSEKDAPMLHIGAAQLIITHFLQPKLENWNGIPILYYTLYF